MKSIFLILAASLLAFTLKANTVNKADLFKIETSLFQEFDKLNEVDAIITSNEYDFEGLMNSTYYIPTGILHDGPLAIPSFWFGFLGGATSCIAPGLGCLAGPAAAIYIKSQSDSLEGKKAMLGCFTGNAVTTIPYIALIALVYM